MPTSIAADAATQRLTDWVTSSGGDVSRVAIREDLDGIRGVAIGDGKISPLETEFMVVPAALALSDDLDELLERSALAAKAGRASLNLLQPDAHLALRLLHEKSMGDDSPWADYISLLPSHVHVARHISDEALLACRSDFLLKQSMLARNYAESVHSTLLRLVGGGEASEGTESLGFTVEELGWALDVVHSRSFSVDAGARGLRRFMVPLIDSASCRIKGCRRDSFHAHPTRSSLAGVCLHVNSRCDALFSAARPCHSCSPQCSTIRPRRAVLLLMTTRTSRRASSSSFLTVRRRARCLALRRAASSFGWTMARRLLKSSGSCMALSHPNPHPMTAPSSWVRTPTPTWTPPPGTPS